MPSGLLHVSSYYLPFWLFHFGPTIGSRILWEYREIGIVTYCCLKTHVSSKWYSWCISDTLSHPLYQHKDMLQEKLCSNTKCDIISCIQAAGLTWLVPLCCVGGNWLGYRGLWHGSWGWGGGRRSLGGLRALRGHGRSGQRITLAHSCCQGGVCSHDGCSGSSPCSGGSIILYSKGLLNCISLRYRMTVCLSG